MMKCFMCSGISSSSLYVFILGWYLWFVCIDLYIIDVLVLSISEMILFMFFIGMFIGRFSERIWGVFCIEGFYRWLGSLGGMSKSRSGLE
jgi:hypothetical protein